MTSVCAVVAVRNERRYLVSLLPYLRDEGVEVVIIDNGSTDGSADIAQIFKGSPVIDIVHQPYEGVFDLSSQLDLKEAIIGRLAHDWIVHQDADEVLESSREGESLLGLVDRADECGAGLIDFDEFVFLPERPNGYPRDDYRSEARDYYFFKPKPSRLGRVFKRELFTGWGESGGHTAGLSATATIEAGHNLRHYIVLDSYHARDKYAARAFSARDLARQGWHWDRLDLSHENLDYMRNRNVLSRLPRASSRSFDRSNPKVLHFFRW